MSLVRNSSDSSIVKCKFCGSTRVIKNGLKKQTQYWLCTECGRGFMDNHALPGMRYSTRDIGLTLSLFYSGMSLHSIQKHFHHKLNLNPSYSTLYTWVIQFTNFAVEKTAQYHAVTGSTRAMVESKKLISRTPVWITDILDCRTGYLIDSALSSDINTDDIGASAMVVADDITVSLRNENAFRLAVPNTCAETSDEGKVLTCLNQSVAEHHHCHGLFHTVNEIMEKRTPIICELKTTESVRIILSGFAVNHNYFSKNPLMENKTPAGAAGITFPYQSWESLIEAQYT